MKSFKEFISLKSKVIQEVNDDKENKNEWKKEFIKLEKGFVPPSNMKYLIQAFLNSSEIKIMDDTSKELTMPKKTLYLSGGSVRDFLKNKTPKNFNLVTNATPEQVALILNNAGFKLKNDSSMKLSFEPEMAKENDDKLWMDGEIKDKPISIIAAVNGDEFEISTFLKDSDSTEYTDDIEEDAKRRDLTINSMYIELSKPDGENNKLYDPTKHGWYDITQGNIKVLGDVGKKFEKDKLKILRMIRFYSQYGQGELSKDIKQAIKELKSDISDIPLEKTKEEFIKGLINPEVDPRKYIKTYANLNILQQIFPDVELNLEVPANFANKKDKILALAWILQNNSLEKVEEILSPVRKVKEKYQETGWSSQERKSVIFLLKLKEFDLDYIDDLIEEKKFVGLSKDQIKNWVDMFDSEGQSTRPQWAKLIKSFASFDPDYTKLLKKGNSNIVKYVNKEKIKDMFDKFHNS
jgi:tRNA nucleotidyltransferase/poly(A) polymerase